MHIDNDDDFMGKMFETIPDDTTPNVFENTNDDDGDDDIVTPPAAANTVETEEGDETIVKYVEFLKQNELIKIPTDYEFTGKPEELEHIFSYTKKANTAEAVDSIFETLPDQFKPLFDYALRGGTSIEEYYNTFVADPLDSANLESPSDQKRILKEHYKQFTKFSDDQIDRRIAQISDEEDLKLEAQEALADLKAIRQEQQVKLLQETAAKAEAERIATEERTLALSKAIDTTNLVHPQRKNKVKTFFFEPINVEGQVTTGFNYTIQSILSTPEHQAQLADILLEYDPATGFSQERLEKKVKSKASQNFQKILEDVLQTKQNKAKTSGSSPATTEFD